MSGGDIAQGLFVLLALILPLSALIARRLDWSRTAQMALVWVAIFLVGIVLVRLIAPMS